jgi:Family of unknown function (DUF6027)
VDSTNDTANQVADVGEPSRPETTGSSRPVNAITIKPVAWTGPWDSDDPDANFKADLALYSHLDPLQTLRTVSANTEIPLGALVLYVLARRASAGSESLLHAGPSVIERMWAECCKAEQAGTGEARLAAYETIRQTIGWLRLPLQT